MSEASLTAIAKSAIWEVSVVVVAGDVAVIVPSRLVSL